MSATISVRSNIAQVRRELDVVGLEVGKLATARAINKTAITVRKEAADEIQKVYRIKVSAAKSRIEIKRASTSNPQAIITASGKPLPLLAFAGTRQNKLGVSVQIKVAGGRKTIAHAFITTTKGGVRAAFTRTGKARYPLRFLRSVGIAQSFASKAVMTALKQVVGDRFPVVYKDELKFALAKSGVLKLRG